MVVAVDGTGHISGTTAVEASDITGLGIAATDTTYADFTSAASGLVPAAKSGTTNYATSGYVLTGAGWKAGTKYNTDNNTTYAAVTTAANGLMTSADKSKLDVIAASANNYTHPSYTSSDSGLKKFTVDATGHVSATAAVTASDITGLGIAATDTTYANFTSAAAGLVPAAKNGTTNYATSGYVLTGAGWAAGTKYNTDNNTTYAAASTSTNGLMTSADKSKLDGIAAGAQVNSITGIKGDSESTYRTGNVNITPANIGAIPSSSIGANSGVAPLNASGLIDSTYLPAYVDDVLEFNGTAAFPTTGTAGIIYVDTSQQENNIYRWSGTSYIVIAKNTDTTYTISKSGNSITLTGSNGYSNSVTDTTYAAATTAAAGLMTSADKSKLDSIAASANKYTHPSYTSSDSGLKKFTVDATGHVSATAAVAASDITGLGIPAQDTTYATFTSAANGLVPAAKNGTTNYATSGYVLTGAGWKAGTKYNTDNNTTYAAVTTAANGLMTSADKSKLDAIAASANNYTHPSYTSSDSGLKKVDATGHVSATAAVAASDITSLGIAATDTTYANFTSSAAGLVPVAASGSTNIATSGYVLTGAGWKAGTKYNTDNNTTYAAVTASANGLMTSTDKSKLDNIAASANNYTHPSYTSYASGMYKVTVDATGHVSGTAAVEKADITALGIPTSNTTYNTFTSRAKSGSTSYLTSAYVLTGAGWQAGTKYNTDTTYANYSSAAAGLVPAPTATQATTGYVLTGTGWQAGTKYNTDTNTTYAAVTSTANGLMSKDDKIKLDTIAASANNYSHPTYTSAASGFRKFTVDATGHVSATAAVAQSDITGLGIPTTATFASATAGLVPAPTSDQATSGYVLTGTGWQAGTKYNTDTTYANFTSAAAGLVPEAKSGTTNMATSGYVLTGAGWKAGTKYNTDNNTTYAAVTASANGLMTSTDKSKLDAIAASANNYTQVDATGHVSATAAVAASDITSLGIAATDTTYANFTSAAAGLVPEAKSGTTNYATSGYVLTGAGWKAGTKYNTDNNTTYAAVTTAANGLMTSTDKSKLDAIAASANNYSHPTYTSYASGLRKFTVDATGHISGTAAVEKADITALGIPTSNTTYATFTSAANGLVPAAKNGTTNYATSGYVLTGAGWAAGTKYNTDTNTTYTNFGSGTAGLVPAPTSDQATSGYVLTGTGWAVGTKYNTDSTYANFTSAAPGLVPAAASGSTNIATSGYVLTGAGWKAGTKYNTDNNTTYAAVTASANGLMTSTDKSKLDNIAASANNYTHPSYTSAASGLYKVAVDGTGHISGATSVVTSDITGLGIATTATYTSAANGLVPAAKSGSTSYLTSAYVLTGAGWQSGTKYNTDTTYANFTSAAAGLVPEAKSGTTNMATSGYVLTGAGWKAGTKYNTDNNTTYAAVTTAANGLMTSADKSKLDAIAASANNYTHPSYTSAASGFRKFTVDATGHVSATAAVAQSDITGLGIPTTATFTSAASGLVPAAKSGTSNWATSGYVLTGAGWAAGTKYNTDTNTTYAVATTAANGLMSSADKFKSDKLTGIYTVKGTQTAATASWTGNIDVPALYDGLTIAYYLPYAGVSSTNVTLNLTLSDGTTTTGAIDCYFNNESRLTTQYSAGSTIILTYWSAGSISVAGTSTTNARWTHADYNSNTTYATFTSATNGLVPAAKSGTTNYATSGYVLTGAGWKAGTKYNTDNNTTYATFTSAANGLVPAPTATQATSGYVLTGTGWAVGTKYNTDTNTTYATFTSAANGLVPAAKSGSTSYLTSAYVLTGAGWQAGTKYNTDTTYAAATSAADGLTKASYVDGTTLYVF